MLLKRASVEMLGTAFLLAIVVGSGIMGERISGGNVALALLANAFATGAGLVVLILAFGPLSGAHFNPLVTLVETLLGRRPARDLLAYVPAQFVGALVGVFVAHFLFEVPVFEVSTKVRGGVPLAASEVVATLGLFVTILFVGRNRPETIPYAVGAYITSAYWFTSSTSFANPAVTLARAFTPTFAGIRLNDVPGFLAAQLLGAGIGLALFRFFYVSEKSQ